LLKFVYLILLFPNIVYACQTWEASIGKNKLLGWDYLLNPEGMTVVTDPVAVKSTVLKLTITPESLWPNGQTRVEAKHNGCQTGEGENTFISWEFYLDKNIQTKNSIAYWETNKTYQQSMGMYLSPFIVDSKEATQFTFFSRLPKSQIHWQQVIEPNKWQRIALAIKWSALQSDGKISLWLNGKPIFTELATQTKPDENELFIQLGLHRNQAESVVDSIYLRNITEFSNLAALLRSE
jgi:hypothetical protein